MPRDSRVYLEDILEAIPRVRAYTEGYSRDEFRTDPRTVDAVVRNLEIIQAYFGVDLEIVWDIVQSELPDLQESASSLLDEEDRRV